MRLPNHEFSLVPEGIYAIRVSEAPEIRKKTIQSERGPREVRWVKFKFQLSQGGSKTLTMADNFFTHEKRYLDLLKVLGGTEDPDGKVTPPDDRDVIGKVFEGEVTHVQDKKDATVTRARVTTIIMPKEHEDEDVPPPSDLDSDDDIPF